MLQNLSVRLTGASPLILHNGQLVDPQYWASKELKAISGKRAKTEADLEEMSHIEFLGSLYVNDEKQVIIPDMLMTAALTKGAMKLKLGGQAKAGLFAENHAVLNYGEQLTPEELWKARKYQLRVGAKVGMAKIMRTRPIFNAWSAEVRLAYDDALLNESAVVEICKAAGAQCGLGDWRPRYGRFTVTKF